MAKHGIFPRGEGFKPVHLPTTTLRMAALIALLLAALSAWVIVLLLFLELTRQLLDTLRFIVELGAMN